MDANLTCEQILRYIKLSNLNFNIVESPFSATITLKKTFIKNKDGTSCLSGLDISPNQVLIPSTQSDEHKFSPETQQYPRKSFSTTKNTLKSEPKYEQYFPSNFNFNPLQRKSFQSMDISINPKPVKQESSTSMDFTINPKPFNQLLGDDGHMGEGIMPKQFPLLTYRAAGPKPILQHQDLPTPFFSSQTPPVQTVSTSTRTSPPPLATPPAKLPIQSFLSPKIPLDMPPPKPALSCSPHTPPGTPPLLRALKQPQSEDMKETKIEVNEFEEKNYKYLCRCNRQ